MDETKKMKIERKAENEILEIKNWKIRTTRLPNLQNFQLKNFNKISKNKNLIA